MKLSAQATIAASRQDVWKAISSPAAMALWQNGYQSTVMVKGEPGALYSVANHIFEEKGKKVNVSEHISSLSPPSERISELEYPVMKQKVHVSLKGDNPVSVSIEIHATMKAFSLKIFSAWLHKSFQEKLDSDLKQLISVVEPTDSLEE